MAGKKGRKRKEKEGKERKEGKEGKEGKERRCEEIVVALYDIGNTSGLAVAPASLSLLHTSKCIEYKWKSNNQKLNVAGQCLPSPCL